MKTLQIDDETKQELERLSRQENRPEGEVVRDLVANAKYDRALQNMERSVKQRLGELGIKTTEQLEAFLAR